MARGGFEIERAIPGHLRCDGGKNAAPKWFLHAMRFCVTIKCHWKAVGSKRPYSKSPRACSESTPRARNWRRGGDSNPRYQFTRYNGLANRRFRPLSHLSQPSHRARSDCLRTANLALQHTWNNGKINFDAING